MIWGGALDYHCLYIIAAYFMKKSKIALANKLSPQIAG